MQSGRNGFAGRRRAPVWCAVCLIAVLALLPRADLSAEGPATTGSIHGKVTLTRKLTSQRMRFRLYPGFKPQAPPAASEFSDDERRNVVVYLEDAPALDTSPNSTEPPQIVQLGETFIPHVLPVVTGTTVEFPNDDPIFHNVFSLSATRTFDLGRYPQGDSRSVTFDQAGVAPVFCHLHSDMSAVVLVLDNPFFATPGNDGEYVITGIPPGSYTLVGWHERSERVQHQVNVVAGESLELNIVIPIEDEEG